MAPLPSSFFHLVAAEHGFSTWPSAGSPCRPPDWLATAAEGARFRTSGLAL